MSKIIHKTISDGTKLTIVPSDKFKTSVMGVSFILPLGTEYAAAYAILPKVLRRGTAKYNDMQRIGNALDTLYGARIEPFVRKRGENLVIGFNSDVVDEKYISNAKDLTKSVATLLLSFFNQPYLINGCFNEEYVQSEKKNLADKIQAQKNDTRSYAVRRLHEEMCKDEAFGFNEFGTIEQVNALTPEFIKQAYDDVMKNAKIQLFYCGGMNETVVEDAFKEAIGERAVQKAYNISTEVIANPKQEVRTVKQQMNVSQGKLSIGFRTGVTANDEIYPSMLILNTIFGSSTSSRLFLNVREKMSLCYYASSSIDKQKGIMTVASGIENDNFDVARDEILRQLDDLKNGNITQEELENAKRTVIGSLRSIEDDASSLQEFWMGQEIAGFTWDTTWLIKEIQNVDIAKATQAANLVKLDTIYFLEGVNA